MPQHGAELLELVYAAPGHDAHRLVYADWLLARGDPRGEFIMLQFKRESHGLSRADTEHERALLDAHAQTWLGGLAQVIDRRHMIFRKGFLHECAVAFQSRWQRRRMRKAPEWATVEKLATSDASVLSWPSLRSLACLGPVHMNVIADLRRRKPVPRITEARLHIQSWAEDNRRLLSWALPNLARLELLYPDSYTAEWRDFQPHSFATLLDQKSAPGLEAVRIRKRVLMSYPRWRDFTESRPDLAAWAETVARCSNQVHEIRLEPCHGWAFSFVRQGRGPWLLEIDWYTASASADPKTLELALTRPISAHIPAVRARIHGLSRPHHRVILDRILGRLAHSEYTIEAVLDD